jgi:hypothetical protein
MHAKETIRKLLQEQTRKGQKSQRAEVGHALLCHLHMNVFGAGAPL